jgi:histidinol-phosphate aminotransferase
MNSMSNAQSSKENEDEFRAQEAPVVGYTPPARDPRIKWILDANEGRPSETALAALRGAGVSEIARRYPRTTDLEADIAACPKEGYAPLSPAQVIVTAGGDDAIARAARVFLKPGSTLIVFEPAFEMYGICARLCGARTVGIPWLPGENFPLSRTIDTARREKAAAIALVNPANPAGTLATPEETLALMNALPNVSVWHDGAYADFAKTDSMAAALSRPNGLAIRTFSKTYGLAGLRVGWAAGRPEVIAAMRAAGDPYPVTGPSLAAAKAARSPAGEAQTAKIVARMIEERDLLYKLLITLGARAYPSETDFVFSRVRDPMGLKESMASLGVAIRVYPGRPGLEDGMRISSPADPEGFEALACALRASKEYL